MKYEGALKKMKTLPTQPVKYTLELGDDFLIMNQLIGRQLRFTFQGHYICHCGIDVPRVYRANFCYDCYFSKPEAGESIFRPELSKAHMGIADRDLEFEMSYQLQPHVVYLANSGGLKVGVTRSIQKHTRWIDQGASAAIVLAETPNRYLAGCIEVELKNHLSDKTIWQKMLTAGQTEVDLLAEKHKALALLPEELGAYASVNHEVQTFQYPVEKYPQKINSATLAKQPDLKGTLTGIRGQYLILDNASVMNIRSHEGYVVALDVL